MAQIGRVLLACAALGLLAWPGLARAHPLLDQAQQRFDEADFDGALELYAQAEAASDLTRDEVVQLYLRRALLYHAIGRTEELQSDLFRLATIDPEIEMGRQIPPNVRRAFEQVTADLAGPIRVQVDTETTPAGVRLTARVENDAAAIIREVKLGARVRGGQYRIGNNAPVELAASADQSVEYWAEAIGPGGAVIASRGTPDQPRILSRDGSTTGNGGNEGNGNAIGPGDGGDGGGGVPWWPFVVGGAVLAAGAVVLAVLLAGGGGQSGQTMVLPPSCCEGMP